jgi:hypothetical protein
VPRMPRLSEGFGGGLCESIGVNRLGRLETVLVLVWSQINSWGCAKVACRECVSATGGLVRIGCC